MNFRRRLTLVALLIAIFVNIGLAYTEPAAMSSNLADYLEEQNVADAAAIRTHIRDYLSKRADIKAILLAAPWAVALVMLMRPTDGRTEKDRVRRQKQGEGQ